MIILAIVTAVDGAPIFFKNSHTHSHSYTHRHTDTDTQTHTHTHTQGTSKSPFDLSDQCFVR